MKRALYININTMWGSCTMHESKKQNKTKQKTALTSISTIIMMLHHYDSHRNLVSSYRHGNCLQLTIVAPKEKWVKAETTLTPLKQE